MLASYAIYSTPSGRRSFEKLPQEVKDYLLKELQGLKVDPLRGEKLKGVFSYLRSLHTRFKATDYRIAYEVIENKFEIVVHYIAARENFYKQLARLNLKPTR
jgi:mRNA-degrading endonuclease RelE of RelBE toxin-antitoxin system